MAKEPTFVGIDLGTTFCAVAYVNNIGKVEIIPNDRSQPVTPSVVMFPEGGDEDPIVGERAKRLARFSPDRVVEYVKRHMGDPTWSFRVDGQVYNAEEISALVLRELRKMAAQFLDREVAEAVITVPAYFDDGERHATKLAGELAGLHVLGILNEPTAAAIAYGLDHAVDEGKALVYDLGGGTFDVTVVEFDKGNVKVLATDGVRLLGGIDWDAKLADYVAHEFMVKFGPDPREDLKSAQRLADEVEAAKRSLSTHLRAKVFLECGEAAGSIPITREKFDDLTEGLLLQTEAYTEAVLEKAELDWTDIDRIILAGGSTRMPMVRQMLRDLSGKDPDTSLNPDECVAIGAAYYATKLKVKSGGASKLEKTVADVARNLSVSNVASHSIGITTVVDGIRQNLVMIREQTSLPAEVTKFFATHSDNQVTVEIKVLEGDSEDPADCSQLGTALISGLPGKRKRGSKIEVTYVYSDEGILTVRARDVESGKNCVATINRGQGSDRPEQIVAMKSKLDALYTLEGDTAEEYEARRVEKKKAREPAAPPPAPRPAPKAVPKAAPPAPQKPPARPAPSRAMVHVTPESYEGDQDEDGLDEAPAVDGTSLEDAALATRQLDRLRDELSSIAEDAVLDGAPALIGGDVGPSSRGSQAEFDALGDEDSELSEEAMAEGDQPRQSRSAATAKAPAEDPNPWDMAADQGLLPGEQGPSTEGTDDPEEEALYASASDASESATEDDPEGYGEAGEDAPEAPYPGVNDPYGDGDDLYGEDAGASDSDELYDEGPASETGEDPYGEADLEDAEGFGRS